MSLDTIGHKLNLLTQSMVADRRSFHRHPELAFEEVRTARIVAERLATVGFEVRTGVGGTGVLGRLSTGRPGPTVLIRCEMDALPIQERSSAPYRSTIDGVMHACGHDGHLAVSLASATVLAGVVEELCGTIVFAFQPAEEIGQGARAMLDDGALEWTKPTYILGMHLGTKYPVGTAAVREGPFMAATDSFDIKVSGVAGHAAKPHEVVDPLVTAAQIISGLQTIVSRNTDPIDQAVLSITSIRGGDAYNIIPECVHLRGTLRTFLAPTRTILKERVSDLCYSVAKGFRAAASVQWVRETPMVVNDKNVALRVRRVAEQFAKRVVEADQLMGGDDLAEWFSHAPGCYFYMGVRNEGQGIDKPHHHPEFDLDEEGLPVAAEVLTRCVVDLLNA